MASKKSTPKVDGYAGLTLAEAVKKSRAAGNKVTYRLAYLRMTRLKWSIADAVTIPAGAKVTPNHTKSLYNYRDGEYSLSEISKMTGIARGTLYQRLRNGWSSERAFNTPVDADPVTDIEEPTE